jgi:hypothetical protein
MKFLGKGTTGKIVEDSEEKLETLLRTFRANLQNKYNRYALAFFACELLNLVTKGRFQQISLRLFYGKQCGAVVSNLVVIRHIKMLRQTIVQK